MKTEWTVVRVTFMRVVTNLCSRRNHQGDGTCFHGNCHLMHCEAFSSSSQCNYYPIHWYGLEQSNKFKMSATMIICEYICTFPWRLCLQMKTSSMTQYLSMQGKHFFYNSILVVILISLSQV